MKALQHTHPTTKRLITIRSIRSLGQGILVVDLSLYLMALGWNGFHIGLVLSAAGLTGAFLSLLVGIASDRIRRKPFLLVYEIIVIVSSAAFMLTQQPLILSAAIVAAGFGRGANGAAGPFSPVEQAWLAENISPSRRGVIYSANTGFGFFGMGFGALLAMMPEFINHMMPIDQTNHLLQADAFRPLFVVVFITSIINFVLITKTNETYQGTKHLKKGMIDAEELSILREENRKLKGLFFLNSFNGLAIGLTGPLISYWFATKFGVGPASIAPIMAATFFITGLASLFTGKLSQKAGIVTSIVWTRSIGLILLVLLPLSPYFWLASVIYVLRSALNRGSIGNRQALTIGLVRDKRRGLATSLNAVSSQLPQSLGPTISGFLFNLGELQIPFYAGAVLQGIYLVLYRRFFKDQNKPH
ncbi:MAG: MFS transporter [Microbacter sp.]